MSEEGKIDDRHQTENSQLSGDENSLSTGNDQPTTELKDSSQPQAATQPQTTNLPAGQAGSKLQTETMEVHHHGHVHEKKKWLEYLFQFLMLFLAVFLGFLAENQREHFVEGLRAKEYAKGFLSDLTDDTTEIHNAFRAEKFRGSSIDSIISIALKLKRKLVVPGEFYYHSRFVSNLYTVDWNSSTISQLVQSGNLRLFKSKELVNKINKYYALQNIINRGDEYSHQSRMKAAELRNKILQSRYYSTFFALDFMTELYGHRPSPAVDSLMRLQLPLNSHAHLYLDEYINTLGDWRWRLERNFNSNYPAATKGAEEIIHMLKQEYSLH